jgi:hypothetical protein
MSGEMRKGVFVGDWRSQLSKCGSDLMGERVGSVMLCLALDSRPDSGPKSSSGEQMATIYSMQ